MLEGAICFVGKTGASSGTGGELKSGIYASTKRRDAKRSPEQPHCFLKVHGHLGGTDSKLPFKEFGKV